ncbi:hypothetical protein BTVI_38086 [Pitangus sulphuratus]|nr:hypothetical protein BTVI_38086 [Pitangus sulphuratus]
MCQRPAAHPCAGAHAHAPLHPLDALSLLQPEGSELCLLPDTSACGFLLTGTSGLDGVSPETFANGRRETIVIRSLSSVSGKGIVVANLSTNSSDRNGSGNQPQRMSTLAFEYTCQATFSSVTSLLSRTVVWLELMEAEEDQDGQEGHMPMNIHVLKELKFYYFCYRNSPPSPSRFALSLDVNSSLFYINLLIDKCLASGTMFP